VREEGVFDHERLDVYRLELEFVRWVGQLLEEVEGSRRPNQGEVINQIDRSSLSSLLNTAEGNGKRLPRQRAKFFDDARGSGFESAACLDAMVAKGMASLERIIEGKRMLVRIVSMLTKLVERFESDAYGSKEDK
jgi:four helix bundle protein